MSSMTRKAMTKYKKMQLLASSSIFAALSCALSGCSESDFDLSPDSRLPQWVALPSGVARADVSVTMFYYIKPWGRTATFVLKDKEKKILMKVDGRQQGLEPFQLNNLPKGTAPGYPVYEIITVGDMVEVIEHRKMEPLFYVSDDAAVLRALGVGR
jgi:hypothetical protein